jgi:hypothetical protein
MIDKLTRLPYLPCALAALKSSANIMQRMKHQACELTAHVQGKSSPSSWQTYFNWLI